MGHPVTTRFIWEGFRLQQEVHGGVPLNYVYSDQGSYEPLVRIDGIDAPEILWFHCQPNSTPEQMTDVEGQVRWEGASLMDEVSIQGFTTIYSATMIRMRGGLRSSTR